eukprot:CAMPEP_0119430490 /NCGR_PEP_ID=MMETSP1335-20130426/44184_1 /TAXON_ID=259385 /ORGANISM="Chrysoculter rhomboideus, Strain RCC1486" /LENGTH=47 /DNA_ID= /DNA_START= /DNA_END= /DNA_ORIENTATION=
MPSSENHLALSPPTERLPHNSNPRGFLRLFLVQETSKVSAKSYVAAL